MDWNFRFFSEKTSNDIILSGFASISFVKYELKSYTYFKNNTSVFFKVVKAQLNLMF